LKNLLDSDEIESPIAREERLSRFFGTSIEEDDEPVRRLNYRLGSRLNSRALPRMGRALPRWGRALPRIGRALPRIG